MNQKFYKIKCSSEIGIHKSDEIYINPTQISIITPTFDIMEKAKGNLIVDGSQIHFASSDSGTYSIFTDYKPEELIKMFSK